MLPAFRASLPVSPFASLTFRGLDSLFHNVFGDDGDRLKPVWVRNAVPISVWQDDNAVYLEAELPGVAEEDLEITVHDGILTVKGEPHEEEGRSYIYNGRTFGRFERAVTLPDQRRFGARGGDVGQRSPPDQSAEGSPGQAAQDRTQDVLKRSWRSESLSDRGSLIRSTTLSRTA